MLKSSVPYTPPHISLLTSGGRLLREAPLICASLCLPDALEARVVVWHVLPGTRANAGSRHASTAMFVLSARATIALPSAPC